MNSQPYEEDTIEQALQTVSHLLAEQFYSFETLLLLKKKIIQAIDVALFQNTSRPEEPQEENEKEADLLEKMNDILSMYLREGSIHPEKTLQKETSEKLLALILSYRITGADQK